MSLSVMLDDDLFYQLILNSRHIYKKLLLLFFLPWRSFLTFSQIFGDCAMVFYLSQRFF